MSFPNHAPTNDLEYRNTNEPNYNLEFSAEETRVLRECHTESFYYRCLPLMIVSGLGAHYAVQKGYLKSTQKLKSIPNVTISMILAFIVGKYSYYSKCEEKILALPGGILKEEILKRKNGPKPRLFDGDLVASIMGSRVSDSVDGTKLVSESYVERPMAPFYDSSKTNPNFGEESVKDKRVDSSFRSSS